MDKIRGGDGDPHAEGFGLCLHLVHARLVNVEEPEVGALAGEADGGRAADAIGGAGDEHGLVVQSSVHWDFLRELMG